ncbi:CidA/LrgA family protein [Ramlibacter sp. AW1]|uniref:CidA/LrgA family protein n=1 Tax=Ramlibacter aurantiacus TaxID=2801330 RepID=A0A936ZK43_9BURK|nr:CidA/LrgA family protein [Ramlibacter aurantiacus]MBL0418743.1 CidA/LrgA family protein [Ramlibacter aurantiacus]
MQTLIGIAWLLGLQAAGEVLARALGLPFPGPVVGMLLLLVALNFQPVRDAVRSCAEFLLLHLSLLFVPVAVGVMSYLPLLAAYGGRLALVLLVSTWLGLAVTAVLLRWLLGNEDAGLR